MFYRFLIVFGLLTWAASQAFWGLGVIVGIAVLALAVFFRVLDWTIGPL